MTASGQPNPGRLPHACGRCDARWAGERTCHCGTCHRTFSAWSAFDQHRLGGECQDPATRKLVLRPRVGYEVWGDPGDDDRPGRWDSTMNASGQPKPGLPRPFPKPKPSPRPPTKATGEEVGSCVRTSSGTSQHGSGRGLALSPDAPAQPHSSKTEESR